MGQGDVLELLEKYPQGLTLKDLKKEIGIGEGSLTANLMKLRKRKQIESLPIKNEQGRTYNLYKLSSHIQLALRQEHESKEEHQLVTDAQDGTSNEISKEPG